MNASNPYESPKTNSESRSWRTIDFFVAGLWVAIPIGVFAGTQRLTHVFMDFDAQLPIATQYVLSFHAPVLLTIVSVVVLLAMFFVRHNRTRRRFIWVACVSGLLTGGVCAVSILGPLLSLWLALN